MQTHLWEPANRPETGLLTKLHGSVDWRYLTEDLVVVRDAGFSGNRHKHCILYPGYKGEPKEEPFRRFHEHLRRVVQGEYEPLGRGRFHWCMPFAMTTSIPSSPI